METGTTVILSVAALACIGMGAYYYSKKVNKPALKIEKADSLSMDDVVAWFKSLNLDRAKHTPFVCNNIGNFKLKVERPVSAPYLLLGVYDESNNTLAPYRLFELKSLDKSLKEILDKSPNGLAVLS